MKKILITYLFSLLAITTAFSAPKVVQEDNGARLVPARTIPVPTTVSEKMQKIIARPLGKFMKSTPQNDSEWQMIITEKQSSVPYQIANAKKLFNVAYENQDRNGVNTYTVTPFIAHEDNNDSVIIHIHGGAYVFFNGEGCLPEAMAIASYSNCKTISIDYRTPPNYPFPAALDDVVAVYKDVLKTYKPENIGLFGSSAGGGLAAALTLKLQELNIPLPSAVILGTPWSDLTETGDTYYTNQDIDDILISYPEFGEATSKLYAGSNDRKNPLISPVYGDFNKNYPPVLLISGTRDLLLSCTARLHRKFLNAGINADLQVFEGMSHAFYIVFLDTDESREAFQEMAKFFKKHLGKK